MNYNPEQDSVQDYRSVLKKVEADGQTEDGWTLVQYKTVATCWDLERKPYVVIGMDQA
jgi:hypothetical protein